MGKNMKWLLAAVAVLVVIAVFALSGGKKPEEKPVADAAAPASSESGPLKVAFVYVGPVGDHGWSYRHDVGRREMETALGDKVETTYVEKVSEGADAERVINQLASAGNRLIFTTSFGYMNPTLKAAAQHPEVKFEHATGFKRADNVGTYAARFYEGRYVVGQIAGKMTKTNMLGYIASFPIPEVVRGINAAFLGARKVNPDVKIKVIWVNSWYDPGKESDAAKTLIDQGADVILQHTDSPAPLQVAEERGVWAVGQASDMSKFAPKAQLTAIIDNWGPYYTEQARAVLEGTWKSQDTWGGFRDGMVQLADFNPAIPTDVQALATQVQKDIVADVIHPFAGPIVDQAGVVRVPEGEIASDEMLLGMNFYVQGIDAELPK